jgi:GTPase SAR1 family protein
MQVPPVVDAVHLTREALRSAAGLLGEAGALLTRVEVELHDTDGSGALATDPAALTRALQALKPDVVVLCCAMDDPTSFTRAAQYWLPQLDASGVRRPGWPVLPVLLCGTKRDAFSEGAWPPHAWGRARARKGRADGGR